MEYTVRIVESQVDYLTATLLVGHDRKPLAHLAYGLLDSERAAGNQMTPWSWRSYRGFHCGRLEWGTRPDSDVIRLWGEPSASQYDRVRDVTDHVTRVDLAVTTRLDPFDEELAKERKCSLEKAPRRPGFPQKWDFRETSKHGDTLYVGARSSQFYGRLYNKQRERDIPEYRACWRWEVECKQHAATSAAADLDRAGDRGAFVAGAVSEWFERHAVQPVWSTSSYRLLGKPFLGEPDLARHRKHFALNVRPVINKYVGGAGHVALLETLGLPTHLALQAASVAVVTTPASERYAPLPEATLDTAAQAGYTGLTGPDRPG